MSYMSMEEIMSSSKMEDGSVVKGSEARPEVPRATSGLLAVDLALGGGWPLNSWNEIIGEESSGKTALAYKAIAANQAIDPNWTALWVAAEDYVSEYAEAIGVDPDRMWVVDTNDMEKVLDLILRTLSNRAVDAIVIDSLPSLLTAVEANKAMDEASVATGAQLLSKFFRKSSKAQRRSMLDPDDRPCLLLAINQWRDKIGVMYGDPRTTPGGKAKNYYYLTRVEVRRDEWIAGPTKDIEDRVGQVIKIRTIKNKTHRPQQAAVADFYFTEHGGFGKGDFDVAKDIVNVCLALEAFEGRYKWNGVKIANKRDELYDVVRQDLGLQAELREYALSTLYSDVITDDDDANVDAAAPEEAR
jgi:recombination protein RecA